MHHLGQLAWRFIGAEYVARQFPEDEAWIEATKIGHAEKEAWKTAPTNMSRMAQFKRALDYDHQLAPNTQRCRVFDTGPSGFVTFSSSYLPKIGTIVLRVAPWLFRGEVTSKVAGPATGKTTHLVLTAVAIATERRTFLASRMTN